MSQILINKSRVRVHIRIARNRDLSPERFLTLPDEVLEPFLHAAHGLISGFLVLRIPFQDAIGFW